jgi:hypothetical protein
MQEKKLAIVGSASNTRGLTPYDDESFDIWGLAWRKDMKRATVVFDLHPITEERLEKGNVPKDYIDHLNSLNATIYLYQEMKSVPKAKRYPLEICADWVAKFGTDNNGYYFQSSIAYMFVLGLVLEYKEIHFYGVDLVDLDEYGYQKPNLEYLIGLARASGVRIHIPKLSALVKAPHLYGRVTKQERQGVLHEDLLKARLDNYNKKLDTALETARTLDGAIQEVQQLLKLLEFTERGRPNDIKTP